jgi:hypothetical protein
MIDGVRFTAPKYLFDKKLSSQPTWPFEVKSHVFSLKQIMEIKKLKCPYRVEFLLFIHAQDIYLVYYHSVFTRI